MKNIKVLIIEHSLPYYHLPIWKLLGNHPNIDLTIAYGQGFFTGVETGVPEGIITDDVSFKHMKCDIKRRFMGKVFLWNSASLHLIKNNSYDLIIHQSELKVLSLFLVRLLAKFKKVPFVLWGIGNPLKKSSLTDLLRRWLARRVDGYIFYNELNKSKYKRWGVPDSKLFVAQNSIDIDEIISFTKDYSADKIQRFKEQHKVTNQKVILTVGRLLERKKIDWLIEALGCLKRHEERVKLVIVGNGPEENNLFRLTKELNLSDDVIFTGKLTGIDEIGPWFMCSDVVVAPSQVGHLATEAHAYGVPIVLTDNAQSKGVESDILIPNETGVLYKDGDTQDLADKIQSQLLLSRTNEYSERLQRRALEYAGKEKMANGFITAVGALLGLDLEEIEK